MTTPTETKATVAHWGICPTCKKERRISRNTGKMVSHRRWYVGEVNHGMSFCVGSYQVPESITR